MHNEILGSVDSALAAAVATRDVLYNSWELMLDTGLHAFPLNTTCSRKCWSAKLDYHCFITF